MLLTVAIAPIFIILFYIYWRDKYEREPLRLVIKGFLAGAVIVLPIIFVESILSSLNFDFKSNKIFLAAYDGFIVAGFTEELFKYLATIILFWGSKHFNEKFDGIVYAVSVSLGFACVENIMYVFSENSLHVGLLRAVTAVPAHTIFGIIMGYYIGLAKLGNKNYFFYLFLAFIMPWFLHGLYDFILMTGHNVLLVLFFPYLFYLYFKGFKHMKKHSKESNFNPNNMKFIDEESEDNIT